MGYIGGKKKFIKYIFVAFVKKYITVDGDKMKIFIHTSSETPVGIFRETITLNWNSITPEYLKETAFTNIHNEDKTQRELLRDALDDSFSDMTGYLVTVQFEDENEI